MSTIVKVFWKKHDLNFSHYFYSFFLLNQFINHKISDHTYHVGTFRATRYEAPCMLGEKNNAEGIAARLKIFHYNKIFIHLVLRRWLERTQFSCVLFSCLILGSLGRWWVRCVDCGYLGLGSEVSSELVSTLPFVRLPVLVDLWRRQVLPEQELFVFRGLLLWRF